MSVTLKIREVRKARGWTQVALAKKLGMVQPAFSKLERNRRPRRIDVRLLERIARALKVKVSALLKVE